MDDGPFRIPQPSGRNEHEHPAHHEKPEHEVKHEPKPVKQEAKAVNRTNRYLDENKSKMPFVASVVIVVLLLVGAAGWWVWSNMGSNGIDSGKYQAVFFTNGQVYFGKLHSFTSDYLKLDNIFYIQSSQPTASNPQKTSEQQNSLSLIKLGNEIHGPQDEMVVSKQQVLFYENLKSDSQVSKLITQYNQSHK
jgi:hypothetical protein